MSSSIIFIILLVLVFGFCCGYLFHKYKKLRRDSTSSDHESHTNRQNVMYDDIMFKRSNVSDACEKQDVEMEKNVAYGPLFHKT